MPSFPQRISSFVQRHHQAVFYSFWLLLNLSQARATELFDDEAYYWVYSRFPAWGYFDHPPIIAVLIRAGYTIFHNELGVRLLAVFLNTATIFIIQRLLPRKNDLLFYTIVLSVAVAQIGGILAVPDNPLLFFTALFFLKYGQFLRNMNWRNTLLFGLTMALLLYSKYHGVLIICFTLMSNRKLLNCYQSYLAVLFAAVLFIPHLYWQWAHDFPSVNFHLFERSAETYRVNYTTDYIIGQIALAGPLVGWLLLWAAFAHKPQNAVEQALRNSMIGVYLFFLLCTARGRVEANWTVTAFIALMVLSHQYMLQHERAARWLFRLLPFTMLLVLIGRIYMVVADGPSGWHLPKDEFHHNRDYADMIAQKSKGLPVVILNSYQHASKLWFYGRGPTLSLNSAFYRRNNFNFWPIEDSLIGKKVYVDIDEDSASLYKQFFEPHHWAFPASGTRNNYFSFSRVLLEKARASTWPNGTVSIACTVKAPEPYLSYFQDPVYKQVPLWVVIYRNGDAAEIVESGLTLGSIAHNGQRLVMHPSKKWAYGAYTARLCIESCIQGFPTINSTGVEWMIK